MDLVIRRAKIEDVPWIMEIYNEAILSSFATFDVEPKTLEDRKEWFLSHGDDYPIFVAELNGNIVGWASISRFRDRYAYRYTVEDSIYIKKDYRGMGIGTELLKTLINAAKELGYHTIVGVISSQNVESINLHKKLGFEITGVCKEVGYKFDQWIDVIYMQIML
ncbi:phosphinothricin acetyltransferase [Caldanaerobius fijiensis DSM 17918]|uniref:Phosphinothricin acetyltransferase n=1 Tax=Caldanaerobius fijiensis DSM 17918 TaxID=1121256 RepID=A0A1M4T5T6_9THEO|nr:GNAT family N-acetyltransferase [Caldanaerobius fijiensis]SHE39764.1 phosphinothricin acetyltransferase [Caldanaerobius fijiensis DSM 17918]